MGLNALLVGKLGTRKSSAEGMRDNKLDVHAMRGTAKNDVCGPFLTTNSLCTSTYHRLGLIGTCAYHSGWPDTMRLITNVRLLRSGHTHIWYSTAPTFLLVTRYQLVQDEPTLF